MSAHPMTVAATEALPLVKAVSAEIADFTVGFAAINTHGRTQDANVAGSGAFVTVGSVKGILTAAHVLTNLPAEGHVGLVRFPRMPPTFAERQTIDLAKTERLMLSEGIFTDKGPDLGFLRLAPDDVLHIEARNVFFNLEKRRNVALQDKFDDHARRPYFDGLSGMIHEMTTDLPTEHNARVKGFHALYGVGLVTSGHEANGYDLWDFEVTYEPGSAAPQSFGGMSGGALWRVFCSKDENGQAAITEKRICGVAFFQSELTERRRIIACHGPQSIYGRLLDAIRNKWPSEVS
jgi:hypothetical protein